jgi:hypothetical protein
LLGRFPSTECGFDRWVAVQDGADQRVPTEAFLPGKRIHLCSSLLARSLDPGQSDENIQYADRYGSFHRNLSKKMRTRARVTLEPDVYPPGYSGQGIARRKRSRN